MSKIKINRKIISQLQQFQKYHNFFYVRGGGGSYRNLLARDSWQMSQHWEQIQEWERQIPVQGTEKRGKNALK